MLVLVISPFLSINTYGQRKAVIAVIEFFTWDGMKQIVYVWNIQIIPDSPYFQQSRKDDNTGCDIPFRGFGARHSLILNTHGENNNFINFQAVII